MVESKRTQKHSMMGMFGLDPNKLDFDYEKHFPEHDFLQVYDDDYQPPGANRRPRPVRDGILFCVYRLQKFYLIAYSNDIRFWPEQKLAILYFEIEIINLNFKLNFIFFSSLPTVSDIIALKVVPGQNGPSAQGATKQEALHCHPHHH